MGASTCPSVQWGCQQCLLQNPERSELALNKCHFYTPWKGLALTLQCGHGLRPYDSLQTLFQTPWSSVPHCHGDTVPFICALLRMRFLELHGGVPSSCHDEDCGTVKEWGGRGERKDVTSGSARSPRKNLGAYSTPLEVGAPWQNGVTSGASGSVLSRLGSARSLAGV